MKFKRLITYFISNDFPSLLSNNIHIFVAFNNIFKQLKIRQHPKIEKLGKYFFAKDH